MDFQVDDLGPCLKRIAITVPPDRVREEFDSQYDEINDAVAMPGFRRGRAPRKLLEKRFAEQIGKEVKEKLVQKALETLGEEKKVEALQQPDIDLEPLEVAADQAFSFEFEMITRPEFETPTYKGLEVGAPPVEVKDEQIDEAIDRLRRSAAKLEAAEAKAKVDEGDVLVLDWEARDGDSVEAHDENAYYLYGRGVVAGFVAEGIDEQLKGKAPGAEATADVKVAADDPREEMRDRTYQLHVTLKEIKRYVLPPVDEAFLKRHDFDDEAEMREDIGKQIHRGHTRARDRLAEDRLVEQLLGSVEISLPESFIERELEGWARRTRMNLEMESVPEEEITKRIEGERDDAKTSVETDLRRFFLLDRIADEEDVKVAEQDLLQAVQEIAQAYGRPEEEVLASFRDGGRLAELAAQIRHKKTREIIRRHAEVKDVAEVAADAPKKKTAKKKATKKKAAAKKKAD